MGNGAADTWHGRGDCSAGGTSGGAVSGATETHGTWGTAVTLPLPAAVGTANVNVGAISCPSAGSCAMGGPPGYLVSEVRGAWGKAIAVPGLPAGAAADVQVTLVSCVSPGNCAAAGTYRAGGGQHAFVINQANGIWQKARQVPGLAALDAGRAVAVNALSCAAPGWCTAGGYYTDSHGIMQAWVVSRKAATSTGLALSAARAGYGHEQAERVTVTVSARYGGTPAGTVTVTARSTVVCVVRLAPGTGSCTLTARQLKPGTYHLVARYGGSFHFRSSVSAAKTLTVVK